MDQPAGMGSGLAAPPPLHPYYPLGLELPGYQAPKLPFESVLIVFFGGAAMVFVFVFLITGLFKKLSFFERSMACWFVLTGIIHFVIEGYVVVNPDFHKDTSGHILAEIWKEYAKADSRYATRDAFVISMEAVTAFAWGPLCFVLACGVLGRAPWRHWLTVLVSLGQLYGDVLYFATCTLEGAVHTRPEPLYFWFYFVIVNAVWIVVPLACTAYAAAGATRAQALADKAKRA